MTFYSMKTLRGGKLRFPLPAPNMLPYIDLVRLQMTSMFCVEAFRDSNFNHEISSV